MPEKPEGRELILRLLELAWKPRKIILQTAGLIIAYFIYLIFNKIAPGSFEDAWLAKTIIFIGEVLAYFVILFFMTAIAKITLAEVRGTEEVDSGAALGAALGKLKNIIASPLKIVGIIVGLVIFHVVIDLWGKIPYLGELGWMFSPLVTFPLGIILVATFLVLVLGTMILPTIIVLGKEGPVSELIEFLRRNTIKFLGHFLIALLLAVLTYVVMTEALSWSRQISLTILGDKYHYLKSHEPGYLQHVPGFPGGEPIKVAILKKLVYRSGEAPVRYPPEAERWTLKLAGFIFGILMWLIHISIWGFIVVDFNVAGTLSYLGLTAPPEAEKKEVEVKTEVKEEGPPEAPKKRPRAKKAEEKPGGGSKSEGKNT